MKQLFFIVIGLNLFIFYPQKIIAQTWLPVPIKMDEGVYVLYYDSTLNALIIGGTFTKVDGDTIYSIVGYKYDSIIDFKKGLIYKGFQYGAYVSNLCEYNNYLFAAGDFDSNPYKPDSMNTLARWNGTEWDSILDLYYDNNVLGLDIIDDTLFMSGLFREVNGQRCGGVMSYYNGQLVKCYGGFPDTTDHGVDGVVKYNNELYAYGGIIAPDGELAIGVWNPITQTWGRVGNAFLGDSRSSVAKAIVYKGELYVCVYFQQTAYDAGNYIMKWDGTQWHDIGGLDYFGNDMEIHNGLLYVVGAFVYAGGLYSPGIAVFDGTNWYAITDSTFAPYSVLTLAFYNDGLYVGGGFMNVGKDSINFIAKYNLPLLSSIEQVSKANSSIHIYPDPATNYLQLINLPTQQNIQYSIINTLGQIEVNSTIPANKTQAEIDVSGLPTGVYLIRFTGSNGFMEEQKFVKIN